MCLSTSWRHASTSICDGWRLSYTSKAVVERWHEGWRSRSAPGRWHDVVIAHGPARSDGIPSEGSRIQAAGGRPLSKLKLLLVLLQMVASPALGPNELKNPPNSVSESPNRCAIVNPMNPTHQHQHPHHHQKGAISTTTLSNHNSPPTSQPNIELHHQDPAAVSTSPHPHHQTQTSGPQKCRMQDNLRVFSLASRQHPPLASTAKAQGGGRDTISQPSLSSGGLARKPQAQMRPGGNFEGWEAKRSLRLGRYFPLAYLSQAVIVVVDGVHHSR